MASAPIVLLPGLVQIKTHYTVNPDTGDAPMNLLWFLQRTPVTLTVAQCTTIANAFDPLWGAIYSPWGVSNRSYIGSTVTDYSTAFGASWDTRGLFTPVGGGFVGGTPPNVALLISFKVGERWRGGHFRTYLPYGANNSINSADPENITSTVVTNVTSAYTALEPGMNSIAVGGGLTQREYRQRTDPTHAHLLAIQSFTVQNRVATQRRRVRKAPHH